MNGKEVSSAMSYLGFEFRGYHVGIKSTNLAKIIEKLFLLEKKSKRTLS